MWSDRRKWCWKDNSDAYIDGHYEIDFEDLERRASLPDVSVMLLCSPHNPTGRVWTKEELYRISDICLKYNVFLVSDEIHCELVMPGQTFLPLYSLHHPIIGQSCVCTSASKAFNMAGLQNAQTHANKLKYNTKNQGKKAKLDKDGNVIPERDTSNSKFIAVWEGIAKFCQNWAKRLRQWVNKSMDKEREAAEQKAAQAAMDKVKEDVYNTMLKELDARGYFNDL